MEWTGYFFRYLQVEGAGGQGAEAWRLQGSALISDVNKLSRQLS